MRTLTAIAACGLLGLASMANAAALEVQGPIAARSAPNFRALGVAGQLHLSAFRSDTVPPGRIDLAGPPAYLGQGWPAAALGTAVGGGQRVARGQPGARRRRHRQGRDPPAGCGCAGGTKWWGLQPRAHAADAASLSHEWPIPAFRCDPACSPVPRRRQLSARGPSGSGCGGSGRVCSGR